MSSNPLFTLLRRKNGIVMDPSVKSTHLLSATLVEQGSNLGHCNRTGGYRGRYALMPAMIG